MNWVNVSFRELSECDSHFYVSVNESICVL